MNHSFNVEIAKEYGIHEAIILEHMYFWIAKNIANGKNYFDGHYWTYNSINAFRELFPYMSGATIRRVLQSLEQNGFILKGNYNKASYDRTKWYALTDKAFALYGVQPPAAPENILLGDVLGMCQNEQMQCSDLSKCMCSNQPHPSAQNEQMDVIKTANGFDQNGETIPDINTDNNIIINNNMAFQGQNPGSKNGPGSKGRKEYPKGFERFWEIYPRNDKKIEAYKQYQARLKDGYSEEELIAAASAYAEQCQRSRTAKQYTMQAKTFLSANLAFTDYLKGNSGGTAQSEAFGGEAAAGADQPSEQMDDDATRFFEQILGAVTP